MRECTVRTVKNVLVRLCNIDGQSIQVKRKTKVLPMTNRNRWWFVLHASESLLLALEELWPNGTTADILEIAAMLPTSGSQPSNP